MKRIFVSLALIALVFWAIPSLRATPKESGAPDATVEMHVTHVGIGIGFTKGEGYVEYKGKHYRFKVTGLDAVGVGITTLNAEGDVYNMASLDDFPGTYYGAEAGGTFIEHAKGMVIKNSKGVVIDMRASKTGLGLRLGDQGLKISPEW